MSTKRSEGAKGSGQFPKGKSGNRSGRPPGSRNRGTVLIELLLEGQAEQLTKKAIDLALGGDVTALRLCMERLYPPRKDRPIHLVLPLVETVQQIPQAMARVFAAISEGEITPTEGEVLSNVLLAHKTALETADLGRRMDEVEQRTATRDAASATASASGVRACQPGATAPTNTSLANRLSRLERSIGPQPAPMSRQVIARAFARAFSGDELTSWVARWEASAASGATSLMDIFPPGTPEREDVLRRLAPALDAMAREMTGRSYEELLRDEAEDQE